MKVKTLISLGALVYLILAPFFYHPDLKIIYYLTGFLGQGAFNIYDFIATHPAAANLGSFVYPPASYFIIGMYQLAARLVAGGDFGIWLSMGNDAVFSGQLFRYILLMKLPLIAVHIASAILLTQLVDTPQRKKWLAALWLFNPVSLYVVVGIGQIDGLAVLTTIAAVVLATKRPHLAAALLGLGGAIKTFPLLFVPLLAGTISGNWKQRLGVLITAGSFYGAFVGPYLTTPAFFSDTLASGLSQRLFLLGPVVPLLIAGMWSLAWTKYRSQSAKLPHLMLAVGLIVLGGINFNPQWLLWITPWVCLWAVQQKNIFAPLLWMISGLILVFLIPDRYLSWGLLSGFENSILFLPAPSTLVSESIASSLQIIARGIFVTSGLFMIVKNVWQK